jgi:hypothetical protein
MSMEDEREAFEKWATSQGFSVERGSRGLYKSLGTNQQFSGWLARAALRAPAEVPHDLDEMHIPPEAPPLPQWLIALIGNYGSARGSRESEPECLHRWRLLLDGIKAYAEMRAALSPEVSSHKQGDALQEARPEWKLVPLEPTNEMIAAFYAANVPTDVDGEPTGAATVLWAAMLAAIPPQAPHKDQEQQG